MAFLSRSACLLALVVAADVIAAGQPLPQVEIRRFLPDKPFSRALRPSPLSADILNSGDADVTISATLTLPQGVRLLKTTAPGPILLSAGDGERTLAWEVEAEKALAGEVELALSIDGKPAAKQSLFIQFHPPIEQRRLPYIPEPTPAPTRMLIGAHHCPLWEKDRPDMWLNVLKHPERMPVLGLYAQDNPEVADWETKWAVEHGISFFVYCWYRTSQGGAVQTQFGSAIHDALFKSRFVGKMKFTIMWENQARGKAGVADEKDLFTNLLPYWIDTYFKHPSYLKVDNKPVLFIYRPEYLVQDLGGAANVRRAFERMRQACRDAGFDGLHILGEYRGTDRNVLTMLRDLGLEYTFAYCWHVQNNPTPEQAIRAQLQSIRRTHELNVLPQVVTVSQGWSGWADEGSIWTIPPADFERLLRQAADFTAKLPKDQLGSRMLLLDNWNEWGEGHFIAPYRQYGFGYLDAVRRVFSTAPEAHEDLVPEDIGMGPYDTAIRAHFERETQHRRLMTKRVLRPDAPEGLVGWWTFDEEADSPVALDVSGHRLGGSLHKSRRAPGFESSALVCDGGCVVVPGSPQLSVTKALTIECRVRTDLAGQNDKWIVNRIFGGGQSTGFRLGLAQGRPCFGLPVTDWSHHLTAPDALPLGRWVHLAATFDGRTMRLYVDGVERATLDRPGDVRGNDYKLVLGSYEPDHRAHFSGLLDDVRLYRRALPAEEIRAHAQR